MIHGARLFCNEFDVFSASPLPGLLMEATAKQAYCLGNTGEAYAVYLPEGGSVVLDPVVYTDNVEVRWLDVESGKFSGPEELAIQWSGYSGMLKTQKTKGELLLAAPTSSIFTYHHQWIALVTVKK